jgi:uncharacterized protein YodC (DUF2158 family)
MPSASDTNCGWEAGLHELSKLLDIGIHSNGHGYLNRAPHSRSLGALEGVSAMVLSLLGVMESPAPGIISQFAMHRSDSTGSRGRFILNSLQRGEMDMADVFKPGDVVQLKSGGPIMTVLEVGADSYTGKPMVWCTWFDDKKKRENDAFPPQALTPA